MDSPTDSRLKSLRGHSQALQLECRELQTKFHREFTLHHKLCSESLHESRQCLLTVMITVEKADSELLRWYGRSDNVKRALRLIGINKKTDAIINKKTEKLQRKVENLQESFKQTDVLFDHSRLDVDAMRSALARLASPDYDSLSRQLRSTRADYTQRIQRTDLDLKVQRAEYEMELETANDLAHALDATTEQMEKSRNAATRGAARSALGLSVAYASAVLFPPSMLVTGSLVAFGAVSGMVAFNNNGNAMKLWHKQQSLGAELCEHKSAIVDTEMELDLLAGDRVAYAAIVDEIQTMLLQKHKMQENSLCTLEQLHKVAIILDSLQLMVKNTQKELQECRFEDTRHGISGKLRAACQVMEGVPDISNLRKGLDVDKVMSKLDEMDRRTPRVMEIIASAIKAST